MKKLVESLIKKAAKQGDATDALHYSQAALNAAQAIATLANVPD